MPDENVSVLEFGGLTPKQMLFMQATTKYVGYGGARGGGKSYAARYKAVGMAIQYPGIRILMVRAHYNELEENLINPILRWVPDGMRSYNGSKHLLKFFNGSEIKFGHWDSEAAENEYQGIEYDEIFIDEATQFSERTFRYLASCLRGANPNYPRRMYLTCNPGGVGHRWVKRLFIDKRYIKDDKDPRANENPEDYTFISAKVSDNPYLMEASPGYVQQLAALPPDLKAAHLDGDWDALSGSYFKNFSVGRHTCNPFVFPKDWPLYRSFDYGLDQFSCCWWTVDTDGRCWMYRYFEESNLVIKDAAKAAREHTLPDEDISITYAPPDMWNRTKDNGKTLAELFAQYKVPIVRSDNNRQQGHLIVRNMLQPIELHDPFVISLFPEGKVPKKLPGLIIFNICTNAIEDIRDIQADEKNPNDCAKLPHDVTHSVDAIRYFCVSRVLPAEVKEDKSQNFWDEEEEPVAGMEEYMCGGEITDAYMNYSA